MEITDSFNGNFPFKLPVNEASVPLKTITEKFLQMNNLNNIVVSEEDILISQTHFNEGELHEKDHCFEKAEICYRKAIEVNPKNNLAYRNLVYLLFLKRKFEEAETLIKKAIDLDPDDRLTQTYLGALYRYIGKQEEAERILKDEIKIDFKNSKAHKFLADYYEFQDRFSEAEAEYKTAIEIDPNFVIAYMKLALLYYSKKKYADAEREYKSAIVLNNKYASAHKSLALVLRLLKKFDEAKIEYNIALSLNPNDAETHKDFGIFLGEQGQPLEAEKHFKRALELDPLIGFYTLISYTLLDLDKQVVKNKKKIGEGGLGSVYEAKYKAFKFALKILNSDANEKLEQEAQISRYVANIYSPCVIGLLDNPELKEKCMVLEFINGSNLNKNVYDKNENIRNPKYELLYLVYMIELAKGLDYLARLKVIHRDLKPGNIMISKNMELKIIDFGESKKQKNNQTKTREVGTESYMAPENVSDCFVTLDNNFFEEKEIEGNNRQISKAVDVWAFGLIISELFGKSPAWGNSNVIVMLTQRKKFPIPQLIEDEVLILLIESCTMGYPEQRLKIENAINILVTLLKEKLNLHSKKNDLHDLFAKPREGLLFAAKVKNIFEINKKDNLNFHIGYLNIANLFLFQGKIYEAEQYYKKSIQSYDKNYEAYNSLGKIHEVKCNYNEAFQCYKKSLMIKPDNFNGYTNMGKLYENFNFPEKALICYDNTLKINNCNEMSYYNKGRLSQLQGNFNAAMKYYEEAIKINPKNDLVYCSQGYLYEIQNHLVEALNCYIKAYKLGRNENNAKFLGNLLFKMDKLALAELCYKKCLTFSPVRDYYLSILGYLLHVAGNYDKAVTTFKDALNFNEYNLYAATILISIYETRKQSNKSKRSIKNLAASIKGIDEEYNGKPYDIAELITNKYPRYLESQFNITIALALEPMPKEKKAVGWTAKKTPLKAELFMWYAQLLDLQNEKKEADKIYGIYELMTNEPKIELNLQEFFKNLESYEPHVINENDYSFKNNLMKLVKSLNFKMLNDRDNITICSDNQGFLSNKPVQILPISSYANPTISPSDLSNLTYTLQSYKILNKLKFPFPKFHGIYDDISLSYKTGLIISTDLSSNRSSLSEFIKINTEISNLERCNLIIRITQLLSQLQKKLLPNNNFILLNLAPEFISLKPDGKNIYFTNIINPNEFNKEKENHYNSFIRYLSPDLVTRLFKNKEMELSTDNMRSLLSNDVWSLGCILQELFFGLRPFNEAEDTAIAQTLEKSPETILIDEGLAAGYPEVYDVLKHCFELNVEKRINIEDLLNKLNNQRKVYSSKIRCLTHNHKLYKTDITSDTKEWKCQGPLFYNNKEECDEGLTKDNKFKYTCNCLKCVELGVDYCKPCALKDSSLPVLFNYPKHECGLTSVTSKTDWICSTIQNGQVCLSGVSKKSNKIRQHFKCSKCDFDLCDLCFIKYRD